MAFYNVPAGSGCCSLPPVAEIALLKGTDRLFLKHIIYVNFLDTDKLAERMSHWN